ncbi:MAG: hypothetical protein FWH27_18740 [Planctomycetaceae bacterium]|nr:hypothetical protein [Planctomycetaceae bacterium]
MSGTVTLDGDPIADGYVMFRPEPGTASPIVAGTIQNGSYEIPAKKGPVPGNYTVNVSAHKATGKESQNVRRPYGRG